MNSGLPLSTLGKTIATTITKGDQYADKAEQFYKAAGIHLAEAKVRVKKDASLTWGKFLRVHCDGLSISRANEYIQIADGRTSLADMRARAANGMKKVRDVETKGKSETNGRNVTSTRPELPNEIKGSIKSSELDASEMAAVLSVAIHAICNAEGRPHWTLVAKHLRNDSVTKDMIGEITSALTEILKHV